MHAVLGCSASHDSTRATGAEASKLFVKCGRMPSVHYKIGSTTHVWAKRKSNTTEDHDAVAHFLRSLILQQRPIAGQGLLRGGGVGL